jgi:hypothetical protein
MILFFLCGLTDAYVNEIYTPTFKTFRQAGSLQNVCPVEVRCYRNVCRAAD